VLALNRRVPPTSYAEPPNAFFLRLMPDGAPDPGFGGGDGQLEVVGFALGTWTVRANGAILAADGSCCQRGDFLAKILPGGDVDRDFAPVLRTKRVFEFGALAPLPNGDIAVVGNSRYGGPGAVVRLRPGGKLRRSFGHGGVLRLGDTRFNGIAVDPRGRIALVGERRFSQGALVKRISPGGRVERRYPNGIDGRLHSEDIPRIMYSGARLLVFNLGTGSIACRAYCPPHPTLLRFLGGPFKRHHHHGGHRRHR
jgi:hypothetical protein